MAPHREGKRPQVPKPRFPRPPQVIDELNANSKGRNAQIVPKHRLSRSAQVTAKKGGSRSNPGSSRRTTSGPQGHVTSDQPRPQNMTSSAVGMAQAMPPDPSPTTATNIHPSSGKALTTAENVGQLNIYGGWFLNSPQAVVQVHGGVPSERGLVDPEDIPQEHDNSLAVPDLEDIENGDTGTQSACQSTQSKGKAKADIQVKDCDVYYRQLLLAGRGSPMWIPGPNMNLPIEYRRNGIRIGDVGIVYRSQGFTFLFNIFLAADHPVNKRRVPNDFKPFEFGQVEMDLEKTIVYGRGHYLASSSLRNVGGIDSSGLVFETVANEGAILVMPDGATTEDLYNHKLMKKYIAKNAKSWYTYIREKRGREVDNGDVRLVIGSDKVASWGIATFSSSAERQVRLEFKTNDSDQLDASRTYTWNCEGGCGRVGPHEKEMEGLREPTDAYAAEFVPENQTVFVRTLNFNLKGEAWDDLTIHEIRSSDHSSNNSGPPSNQQPPSSSSGGQSSTGSRESHSGQGNVNFQAAQFGLSVVQHPSNKLNDLLLKNFPSAQIVVTSDADWISVLTEEDIIFPSPEDLCGRLLSSRKIQEEDGVVTLDLDDDHANSEDEISMTGGRNLNTLSYSTIASETHSGKDLASMTRDAKAAEDSEFDLEVEWARIAPLRARITRNKNKRAMDDILLHKLQMSEHLPAIPYPHISLAYQYPRQQCPSKRRRISKRLSHIPPELIQNGVRLDRPCGSRYASTKPTARGMTGKPTTRKPGHDSLPTSEGAPPTTSTSHQFQEGSHTGSIYRDTTPQSTSPPIVGRGLEDSYQPSMYIPSDDFWPSSSFVPSAASPQILAPTTHVVQTPNLGLQAHFLGDGLESQAVREQSANEVLSPLTDWFELWKTLPLVSPVDAQAALELEMMFLSGGTELPCFPSSFS